MADKKGKRALICLSSSSSSAEEEEEEEEEDDDDNGEDTSCTSSSDDGSEWDDDEEADCDSFEDGEEDEDDDDDESGSDSAKPHDVEANCNRVIHLLKGGSGLQSLKLEECKAYLRQHSLRLTGSKAVCIQRIQEHWRIKDGNGEKLYPRSSFVINCTGDVCKGDVVLFTQRVYERFDKVTRSGNLLGKRTIAGRVVKESYGAAKQQHTFTVEILWSKGFKRLPPLFPLLVKGRNLYRLKTFRQHWSNEVERSKVLAEKHKRGSKARCLRAIKAARSAQGGKRQRQSHLSRSANIRKNQESMPSTKTRAQKRVDSRGKAPRLEPVKMKRVSKPRAPKSTPRHLKRTHPNKDEDPMLHTYTQNGRPHGHSWTQMQTQSKDVSFMVPPNRGAYHFSNLGSTSNAMRVTPVRHYPNPMVPSLHQGYNNSSYNRHAYAESSYHFSARNLNCDRDHGSINRPLHSMHMGAETYRGPMSGHFPCSTPGCWDVGAEGCVVSSCWRCCRRTGRGCLRHQLNSPF